MDEWNRKEKKYKVLLQGQHGEGAELLILHTGSIFSAQHLLSLPSPAQCSGPQSHRLGAASLALCCSRGCC